MNRRDEQALSNAVMDYLAIKGILHYRVRNTGKIIHMRGGGLCYGRDKYAATQRGTPDIFAWQNGKAYAFELKSPTGKVSPEQGEWIEKFKKAGGLGYVIRSVSELVNVFERTF